MIHINLNLLAIAGGAAFVSPYPLLWPLPQQRSDADYRLAASRLRPFRDEKRAAVREAGQVIREHQRSQQH